MRRVTTMIASAAAFALLAAAPTGASAGTVTVGVNLATVSPGNPYNCGATSDCTLFNGFVFANNEAPDGGYSFVNGTITSWTLKTGAGGASAVRLRVIHDINPNLSPALYAGAGSSAMVNAAPFSVTNFPTSLPIQRRDQIGLDCCQSGNDSVNTPDVSAFVFGATGLGPLADGSVRNSDGFASLGGLMFNATIDVDDDLKILSKPKLRKGKVRMLASVPNQGQISLRPKGRLLKFSSGFYDEPGMQEIAVAPTDDGRAVLREGGRVKVKLRVSYRPSYGNETVRQKVSGAVKR